LATLEKGAIVSQLKGNTMTTPQDRWKRIADDPVGQINPDLQWWLGTIFWIVLMFGVVSLFLGVTLWMWMPVAARSAEYGVASVYSGKPSEGGHRTASGVRLDPGALVAAHRRLPFGTRVRVSHKGRAVEVKIIDRGPFVRGRIIDLTPAAAGRLGFHGLAAVRVDVLASPK
jgi:rare lipoprotein A